MQFSFAKMGVTLDKNFGQNKEKEKLEQENKTLTVKLVSDKYILED